MIMTYNRPVTLHRCLESLAFQGLARDCFELVVVDVSADPVTSVLQPFRDGLAIRHEALAPDDVAHVLNFYPRLQGRTA